jgi:hypothetical protein
MPDPSLPELEAERERLYAQLEAVEDFRRGSVSENYRKCGRPNCACAQPDHPGHGPRFLWTRTVPGRRTRGRQLAAGEVAKVRREIGAHREFTSLAGQIAEVNEAICEARPTQPAAAGDGGLSPSGGERGAPRQARGGGVRRDRQAGRRGSTVTGLRRRPGGRRGRDPRGHAEAGRRHAGEAAGRRPGPPRPVGAVRERR